MMTTSPLCKSEETQQIRLFSLLIASPNGDRILARSLPGKVLQLPMLRDTGGLHACGGIGKWTPKAVMEEYGLRVHLIRIETDHHDSIFMRNKVESVIGRSDVIHPEQRVLVLDVLNDEAPVRGDVQWVTRDVAMNANWVQIIRRVDIAEWVCQILEEGSGKRHWKYNEPWKSVGWKSRTCAWVRSVLETKGLYLTESVDEVINGSLSIVLRAKAKAKPRQESNGDGESEYVYIKASVPIWREAERTMAIWGVLGDLMSEVIATNSPNGTMIMRDAGPTPDKEGIDKADVINMIVKMEKMSMDRVEELIDGGLQVLDEEWVARNVEWILHHDALKDDWEPEFEHVTDLKKNIGTIYEACREVASYKFPKTLVHADVCLRNLGKRKEGKGGKYCLYDWDKAFVGNPLLEFWLIAFCSRASGPFHWIKEEEVMTYFQQHWLPSVRFDEMESLFAAAAVVCGVLNLFECILLYEEYGSLLRIDMWECKEESIEFLNSDTLLYQDKKKVLRTVD